MGRKKHLDQLREFKARLNQFIPINKMILFGSRARGKTHRWSDFDLVIVSPTFRKKKFRERSLGFHDYWNINSPVDFLCYTPEEFKKQSQGITIVNQAVKEGIEIK